jgi:hypothetical protein
MGPQQPHNRMMMRLSLAVKGRRTRHFGVRLRVGCSVLVFVQLAQGLADLARAQAMLRTRCLFTRDSF